MPDSPETARARTLDYLRARAASLDAARIRARVRAAAAELEAALAGLEEPDARRPVRPEEWTIAQAVDHIAQSTVRAAEELRHLLAGHRPPGPPIYEGLLSGAAHRVPWPELVAGLGEANAALDAVLACRTRGARPSCSPPSSRGRSTPSSSGSTSWTIESRSGSFARRSAARPDTRPARPRRAGRVTGPPPRRAWTGGARRNRGRRPAP
jgi:hypothetical protein